MALVAQGPLNPPGAPAATMKTLDQIEPRKEVNATNTPGDAAAAFVISQPGSYYLSGNISGVGEKSGIRIDASNVTLDLNGFAIVGELLAQTRGIQVPNAFLNVHIRNGSVRNWPRGIDATGSNGNVFEALRVTNNGPSGGLQSGARAQVNNCTFLNNAGAGLSTGSDASIRGCTATGNAAKGIVTGSAATVSDCQAAGNESRGIETGNGSTIANCAARGNNGIGIATGDFSSITNSTAVGNTDDGFFVRNPGSANLAGQGSTVTGCTAAENSGDGFEVSGGSTISSCTSLVNGGHGFALSYSASITRSTARRNGLDGIRCHQQSVVVDNLATENGTAVAGGAGIRVQSGQGSRIDNNNVVENDRGIEVTDIRNIIVRNTARNNAGRNYVIVAGNRIAQIIVPPTNSAIDGDDPSAAGDFTSTDPWANFSY